MDWQAYLTRSIQQRRAHIRAMHAREGFTPYVRALLSFHAAQCAQLGACNA